MSKIKKITAANFKTFKIFSSDKEFLAAAMKSADININDGDTTPTYSVKTKYKTANTVPKIPIEIKNFLPGIFIFGNAEHEAVIKNIEEAKAARGENSGENIHAHGIIKAANEKIKT